MQDRISQSRRKPLAPHGRTIHRVTKRRTRSEHNESGSPQIADMERTSRHVANGPMLSKKVGATLTTRNNRIAQAGFLNRSCAFDARLESILLEDPLKIFFRQYRPVCDPRSAGANYSYAQVSRASD